MTDLDRLLSIQRSRDYWDDGNMDKEEYESLKSKIQQYEKLWNLVEEYIKQTEFESPDDTVEFLHRMTFLKSLLEKSKNE